ncbi:MAG: acyl--CoA ligase [Candidatus Rokubacteria bacterium]|nr:acyl--CoA ligase [Candidatus Rokubacteria bacterium]
MLPDNLGYLFEAAVTLAPSRPVLFQDDVQLTYAQLDERCNRVATGLARLGAAAGDRVALMFSNDFRFLESLFGPMRIGAVPVPLNTRMGDEALRYVVEDAEATVLIANRAMADRARALATSVSRVKHVVIDGPDVTGGIAYDDLLGSGSATLARRTTALDEVCMQPYTSGSTGKPKGVLLTHGGQVWNADILRKAMLIDDAERALVAVPLFHKNAMAGAVKPFLLAGGSMVILPGFDALEVIRAIDRYRVTYTTGVPAMYKMILAEKDALARHDVSSVRFAVCGSAEVPEELLDELKRVFRGAGIAESYGLTEGGPVPLTNTRWGLKRRGSCGMAFPGSDVRLVDDRGADVAVGEVGELVVRNPGLARGYWKLADATAKKFRDGWLFTGDLLRRDADGYYYFMGRKDDMMNVAGENVYPKEVEDILLAHPNLRDACVVPAPHGTKGVVPVAFVVAREAGRTTEDDVKRFFLERGAPYAHPRRVVFLDALPLGGTGKLDRNALKARAGELGVGA